MAQRNWRNTTALTFGAVALLALLASSGANRLIASYLALPEDAELADLAGLASGAVEAAEAATADGTSRRPLSRTEWVDPIVQRSIFDSTQVGTASVGPTDPHGTGTPTDLKVVLMATLVAEPEIYSSAWISEERGSAPSGGYGIGDDLLGEATILRIERKKVFVRRNNGSVEYIAMDDDTPAPAPRTARTTRTTDDDQVQAVGDNKFVVDSSMLEGVLANPEALATQIRVVPHKGPDGDIDGYRLSGIRRGSFFDKLGVKNGDIVHAVNGKPLTSMSAAMDAYQGLQAERNFSFDLTRRNQKQTFDYDVR